jgi:hypothetical protein
MERLRTPALTLYTARAAIAKQTAAYAGSRSLFRQSSAPCGELVGGCAYQSAGKTTGYKAPNVRTNLLGNAEPRIFWTRGGARHEKGLTTVT